MGESIHLAARSVGSPDATGAALHKVLVVDDSPVDRKLAGRILERQKHWQVSYAADGVEALLYAGAQCDGSGTPDYGGQLICQNGANPAGSLALVAANSISGNPIFSYGCGGLMGGNRRVISWTQRMQ